MTTPAVIRLTRLPTNWNEQPEMFRRWWDETMKAIEDALNTILAIPAIQAAVLAAQQAASDAQDAADDAQAAADSVASDTSIQSSWVEGLTLEAFNDGADCHVDISAHTRNYGDGTSVTVNSGTLSGIAFDTVVRVYYDDAARAGGAVTYAWDSDATVAAQTGDRHSVGSVVTPRLAEVASVVGGGTPPPGYAIP